MDALSYSSFCIFVFLEQLLVDNKSALTLGVHEVAAEHLGKASDQYAILSNTKWMIRAVLVVPAILYELVREQQKQRVDDETDNSVEDENVSDDHENFRPPLESFLMFYVVELRLSGNWNLRDTS